MYFMRYVVQKKQSIISEEEAGNERVCTVLVVFTSDDPYLKVVCVSFFWSIAVRFIVKKKF